MFLGALLLQRLLLKWPLHGSGRLRQVLRAEAEALQQFQDPVVLLLKLRDQVSLCADFIRKLMGKKRKTKSITESVL